MIRRTALRTARGLSEPDKLVRSKRKRARPVGDTMSDVHTPIMEPGGAENLTVHTVRRFIQIHHYQN